VVRALLLACVLCVCVYVPYALVDFAIRSSVYKRAIHAPFGFLAFEMSAWSAGVRTLPGLMERMWR